MTDTEGLREAIDAALHELGEPGPGYPAPVANAVDILRAALRDTGSRPDSEIDAEALVAKLQAAPYHWNERIVHDLREVLSTPRTETSEDRPGDQYES